MERIYITSFWTDSLAEAKEIFAKQNQEMQAAISSHPFFKTKPNETLEDFSLLASLCGELAAHEDAKMEILIDTDQVIQILLTAPCFLFQCRQFVLWQKITRFATEIVFDTTEDNESQIEISLDFSKADKILHRQLKSCFTK